MRLYTKGGDKGDTGLIGGARVHKNDIRVSAYGEVDELNAAIGWVSAACTGAQWRGEMERIQSQLLVVGAVLADPDGHESTPAIAPADVAALETLIDEASEAVEPLKQFILPGGDELAARFHLARTICRRAERSAVALAQAADLPDHVVPYLNRLADLLFAWSRVANHRAGVREVPWNPSGSA